MEKRAGLIVRAEENVYIAEAEALAKRLGARLSGDTISCGELPESKEISVSCGKQMKKGGVHSLPLGIVKASTPPLALSLGRDGLSLTDGTLTMRGDFTRLIPRLTHANLTHELLVKAAKDRRAGNPPTVVDATAGMGEDSLLLAASGFEVFLYEADPVIAALLSDTLRRAAAVPELAEAVSRMHFTQGDSIRAMRQLSFAPDVVVLDPMFPERTKSSQVRKKFQLIHQLEAPCGDEEELMAAARAAGPLRIVIKRPLKGPYLAGTRPSYSLKGKAVRYDCVIL